MASVERLKAFTRAVGIDPDSGTTKGELDLENLRDTVQADPDSAARFVEHFSNIKGLPTPWAQITLAVASMYQYLYSDDTLMELAKAAPWYDGVKVPTIVDGETREPIEHEDLSYLDGPANRLLAFGFEAKDKVSDAVKRFTIDGKPKDHVKKLVATWGRWLLTYNTPDPREVVDIPEARRFITGLHEALPYFPVYLNLHRESGMFFLYFACISDLRARTGMNLNILHEAVVDRVMESLVGIKLVCKKLGRDPEPMYRAVLAAYAGADIQPMLDALREG